MLSNELLPTRSALLQLSEERGVVAEAYDFLDEKRLLLAAELLRQLKRYEELLDEYEILRHRAQQALAAMVRRHGLQGTQVYPPGNLETASVDFRKQLFMGVTLIDTRLVDTRPLEADMSPTMQTAVNPSPEAERCRRLFLRLVQQAALIAGVSGNVYRLFAEYRRTERRARALENVVIPEIEQALRDMGNQLEELDQEDMIRMHLKHSESG